MVVILIVTAPADVPLAVQVIHAVSGEAAKVTEAFNTLKANNDRTEADIANAQV